MHGDGIPYCKGVHLETRHDDGSEEWQRLYDTTKDGPQRDHYSKGKGGAKL